MQFLKERINKLEQPKDKELAKEFKEYVNSMEMSMYYRTEACNTVIEMVNGEISIGKAEDIIQENIKNSNDMLISALSHIGSMESKLEIEKGLIVGN